MRKLLFSSLIFTAGLCFGEGPRYRHKEPVIQQEFQNVYKDIRPFNTVLSTFTASSSEVCIDSPTFCVDLTNNRVGVGSTALSKDFQVRRSKSGSNTSIALSNTSNTSSSDAILLIETAGSSARDPYINWSVSGATNWSAGIRNGNADAWQLATGADLSANSVVIITTDGEMTRAFQPSFLVTDGTGASNVTGDGTVYTQLWPTEVYDQGENFASNTFVASVTGRYLLIASVMTSNLLTTHTDRQLRITTSNRSYFFEEDAGTGTAFTFKSWTISVIADMDVNDTASVAVRIANGTKTVDIEASAVYNQFSGSLIN